MSEFKWEWTDELVKEFVQNKLVVYTGNWVSDSLPVFIRDFKASKQPRPEWSIIAFRDKDTGVVTASEIPERPCCFLSPLNKKFQDIYSVRRLSDGEVFTVGDEFQVQHQPGDHWTINRFEIGSDGDMRLVSSEETGGYNWGLKIAIPYVVQSIPVLLTPAQIEKLHKILNTNEL